jgi:hypothetical protein
MLLPKCELSLNQNIYILKYLYAEIIFKNE